MKSFKFKWLELKFDKKNRSIVIENLLFDVKLKTKFDLILKICASNISSKSYSTKIKISLKSLL